jgi:acylphosphatase
MAGLSSDLDARRRRVCLNAAVVDVSKHILVRGRVQGVGYRAFVEDQALLVGIRGWVRNRRDGSVEAVFTGEPEQVDRLITACRNGPPAARVTDLAQRHARKDELTLPRPGEIFSVLPTT